MDAVLSAEGITKSYRMGEVEVPALRGIAVQLGAGEMVVLLGASGSGKSTLLSIMGGLDIPTAGRILYRDQDLTEANERALTAYRRDHVGFVFQFYNDFMNSDWKMKKPNANPAANSTMRSIHIGKPRAARNARALTAGPAR